MGIGLSGMISGLDTDSIVKAMVAGQQTKATKIENKITLNKWTNEAWSGLNTKIYSFYTKFASKLRLQSSFMTRTAKSSNESVVTATAGSSAAVGTHSLKIKQLASSQYVTGGQLKNASGGKANYSKNTTLTSIEGMTEGTTITIGGEKEVKFTVESDSTINDFLDACKDAGLNANFDTTQQRFFISAQESGAENAFSITADAKSVTGMDAVTSRVAVDYLDDAEKALYNSALKTLSKAAREDEAGIDAAVAAVQKDDFDVAKASELEKAVYDMKTLAMDSRAEKMADSIAVTDGLSEAEIKTRKEDIQKLIQDESLEIDTAKYSAEEIADIEASRTTIKQVENNILAHMKNLTSTEATANLGALGLGTVEAGVAVSAGSNAGGMTVIAAADAVFELDGAEMTETSNNFTVNGITLNLSNTTESKDVPGTYESVQITVVVPSSKVTNAANIKPPLPFE